MPRRNRGPRSADPLAANPSMTICIEGDSGLVLENSPVRGTQEVFGNPRLPLQMPPKAVESPTVTTEPTVKATVGLAGESPTTVDVCEPSNPEDSNVSQASAGSTLYDEGVEPPPITMLSSQATRSSLPSNVRLPPSLVGVGGSIIPSSSEPVVKRMQKRPLRVDSQPSTTKPTVPEISCDSGGLITIVILIAAIVGIISFIGIVALINHFLY